MRFAIVAFFAVAACGPSYRKQARADWVYDECRALDSDPYVHPDTKRRCWQYWLDRYDAHQAAHRIAYAEDRVRENMRAAQAGPEAAGGEEVLPEGAPPPPTEPPIVSPGPGSAQPGAPASAAPSCPDSCHGLWRRCRQACGAGASGDCGRTCNDVLAECIGDCS